jgi:AcrR family transcriptional regulator
MRCIDQYGPTKTSLSDVAADLGVTRQTVYRLYPTTDKLMIAVAAAAIEGYLDRLAAHVAGLTDPAEAVIEGIAYTIERLPKERFLGVLLNTGRANTFLKGVTSSEAMSLGRAMLARMDVDWASWGYNDAELDGLVEFSVRQIQSLILAPPSGKSGAKLRAFLRRWVAPAVRAADQAPGRRTAEPVRARSPKRSSSPARTRRSASTR